MSFLTRADIVTATETVISGNTSVGTVRPWIAATLDDSELPAICLYVTSTDETPAGLAPRSRTDRADTITIDCHASAVDDGSYVTDLDAMTEEVKRLLLNDDTWLGLFETVESITSDLRFDSRSDYVRAISEVKIVVSQTADYEPLTPVDIDLKTVHIDSTHDEAGTDRTEQTEAGDLDT